MQTQDDVAHPTQHVLRPHHVALLSILLLVFHPNHPVKVSVQFLLQIHRILLNEIAEMSEPRPYHELCLQVKNCMDPIPEDAQNLYDALTAMPLHLKTPALIMGFFNDLPALYSDREDETAGPFHRRSFFGYFCRRCFVTFGKLSFAGIARLQEDFVAWASGNTQAGYHHVQKDVIRDDDYLVRYSFDRDAYANPESFADFEKAEAIGDPQLAVENLRKFFEQKFGENSDSYLRQHAMLHLVRLHYTMGQFTACRKHLREAIVCARTVGDNVILQQCMSILRRLNSLDRSQKEPLNELQNDISPLEFLNDVSKLLRHSQPLSDSFEKISQALALYDLFRDWKGGPAEPKDQFAFHCVQSVAWKMAGCQRLATIEENIVLSFTDAGSSEDVRITVLINKAQHLARQGRLDDSLKVMLDPDTWRGLNISANQYKSWAASIWQILLLVCSRRQQKRHIQEWLRARKPTAMGDLREYYFQDRPVRHNNLDAMLHKAMQMRFFDQPAAGIEPLLRGLWLSEYQGHYRSYRLGIILLADIGLEYGMTVWSKKLMDEILPQMINGDDLELRAFACFVQARCIIAASGKNFDGLRDALPYLNIAESDYRTISIPSAILDVLYLKAVIYDALGMVEERDRAASEHIAAEEERRRLDAAPVEQMFLDIWQLVSDAGVALATR